MPGALLSPCVALMVVPTCFIFVTVAQPVAIFWTSAVTSFAFAWKVAWQDAQAGSAAFFVTFFEPTAGGVLSAGGADPVARRVSGAAPWAGAPSEAGAAAASASRAVSGGFTVGLLPP